MIELARWPKQISSDPVMPTVAKAKNVIVPPKVGDKYAQEFTTVAEWFNEPVDRWVGAKIWVNRSRAGLDGQGWTGTVKSVSSNNITVEGSARPSNEPWGLGEGTEYFLFDPLPEAVEATGGVDALFGLGEWWKNGNTLYVKTRDGQAPASSTTAGSHLIEAKRRHFAFIPFQRNRPGYTIQDFHLFACSITTDRAARDFRIADAQNITLSGLVVKYPSHQTDMTGNWQGQYYGWTGIVLSGRNNTIKDCDISLSATSALSFAGANNKMLNNRIHQTNYMCANSGAVNTGNVCQYPEIADNKICES